MQVHVIRVQEIIKVVAKHYGVSMMDLLSARRTKDVVRVRHIAMYLAKNLTLRSLPEIGRQMGGRDHTTILHGVRKVTNRLEKQPELAAEIEQIKRRLGV